MRKWITASFFILSLFALASAILNFSEAYRAANEPIQYHFGSESMIGNGGEYYRSQQIYINHCQIWGTISVVAFLALIGIYFYWKRKILAAIKKPIELP